MFNSGGIFPEQFPNEGPRASTMMPWTRMIRRAIEMPLVKLEMDTNSNQNYATHTSTPYNGLFFPTELEPRPILPMARANVTADDPAGRRQSTEPFDYQGNIYNSSLRNYEPAGCVENGSQRNEEKVFLQTRLRNLAAVANGMSTMTYSVPGRYHDTGDDMSSCATLGVGRQARENISPDTKCIKRDGIEECPKPDGLDLDVEHCDDGTREEKYQGECNFYRPSKKRKTDVIERAASKDPSSDSIHRNENAPSQEVSGGGAEDNSVKEPSHKSGNASDPDGLFDEECQDDGGNNSDSSNSDPDGLFDEESQQDGEGNNSDTNSDPDGLFDDDETSDQEETFGNDLLENGTASPELSFPDPSTLPPLPLIATKRPKDAVQYKGPDVTVFYCEPQNDQYFLKWLWGSRLIIQTIPLTESTGKLQKQVEFNGTKCSLVVVKMIKNKGGNGFARGKAQFETAHAKAYYIALEGPGYKAIDLEQELNKLANFAALNSPGKIVSRLELMVSPAQWSPSKKFPYQYLHDSSCFEEIPEQGNVGCGFFPETFFEGRLGMKEAKSVWAVQVRVFIRKLGVFKGMLVKKQGISKIQLPPSMKKVDKSVTQDEDKGSSDWAFLLIRAIFPSEACKMMGRNLNPHLTEPPKCSSKNLIRLEEGGMYWNLLHVNGVPQDALKNYSYESQTWPGRNHISCIGVTDPTGALPPDTVFQSGVGTVCDQSNQKMIFSKLFVTRPPCTEKKDGVMVKCVRSKPKGMSMADWIFLCSMPFGMLVFSSRSLHPSKKSLPEQINDGDLDGDLYMCFWNGDLLDWISNAEAGIIREEDGASSNSSCSNCQGSNVATQDKGAQSSSLRDKGWFEEVQDVLADVGQLRSYDRLTTALHSSYKKCQKMASFDPYDDATLTLGQAFKNSIDMRKHGGKVGLPADLWGRIRETTLHKYL